MMTTSHKMYKKQVKWDKKKKGRKNGLLGLFSNIFSPGISKSDHFIGEPLKLWTSWRKSLLLDMVTSSQPSSVLQWESNFIDR